MYGLLQNTDSRRLLGQSHLTVNEISLSNCFTQSVGMQSNKIVGFRQIQLCWG